MATQIDLTPGWEPLVCRGISGLAHLPFPPHAAFDTSLRAQGVIVTRVRAGTASGACDVR